MVEDSENSSNIPVRKILRAIGWLGIGILIAGSISFGLLVSILVGVGVSSQAGFYESVGITIAFLTVTIAFWGLVWWAESTGIADWNGGEKEFYETDLEEWNEE